MFCVVLYYDIIVLCLTWYNLPLCTVLNFVHNPIESVTLYVSNDGLFDDAGRPDVVDDRGDRSVELSEIDERLSRLRHFMNENLK